MKNVILLMVAAVLSLSSTVVAQEGAQIDTKPNVSVPADSRLENPAQYRNAWKYRQAFPHDADFFNHIMWTEEAFAKPIVGKVKDSMMAHQITVVIYDGAMYDAEAQTIDLMEELHMPAGSRVVLCQDLTLLNKGAVPQPTSGVYRGTEFTILLPDSVYSWDVMDGHFGRWTNYGYMHIDPLGFMFADPPPTVNDTQFNGYQGQWNGNIANILFNQFNMGWGYWQAIVPSNGHTQRNAIHDTGADTMHQDIRVYMIDTADCWSVPTANKDFDDGAGHGTATASLMMGMANNSYGIVGADCNDTNLIYKVWSTMAGGPTSNVTTTANYGYSKGSTINNYSLGGTTYDPTFAATIALGFSTYNSWAIAAAGNSGSLSNTTYPACLPNVMNVVGTTLSGGAWTGSTTSDSAFVGVCSQNVMSANYNSVNTCGSQTGTSVGSPQFAGIVAKMRNLFPDFSLNQTKALLIRMMNGGGVRTQDKGYGIITDSLVLKVLREYYMFDDTLTVTTCVSGKQRVGALQPRFKWVDSGFVLTGAPLIAGAMTAGDTVNFNLVPPGTYTIKRWVKSMPEIPGYSTAWYDTVNLVIIVNGTAGTTPSTTISTGSTTVCSSSSFTFTTSGNTGSATKTWYRNNVNVGTGNSFTQPSGLTPGTYTYFCVADLATTTTCWTKAKDTSNSITVTVITVTAAPGSITGNTSVCGGSSNTYSVTAVAGATSYTWTLPTGWTGTSTTNSITTTAGTSGGTISVTANNSCGSSTASTLSVSVTNAPATPGSISGLTAVCNGSTNTYSITAVPGATSYTWTLPTGWTGTSTTNSISATAGSTGGTISVTANNSCGSSSAATLSVTVNNIPSTPGSITGSASVCAGSSNMYSITAVTGATSYTWTLPTGWTGTSTTNSISTTAGTTGGTISVTANNSCGSSSAATLSVAVTTPVTPSVTIIANPAGPICAGTNVTFAATPVNGGTTPTYQWKVNGINVGTGGPTYSSSTLANGDVVTVVMTTSLSCVTAATGTSPGITMIVNPLMPPPTISVSAGAPYPAMSQWLVDYTFGSFAGPYDVYRKVGGVWIFQVTIPGNTWTHTMDAAADTVSGVYHVSGCYTVDSSISNTVIVSSPVSVAALPATDKLQIYPNPTSSLMFIRGLPDDCLISVFAVDGRLISTNQISKQGQEVKVDLSAYASGVYQVRIHADRGKGESRTYKVVKQ